MLCLEDIAVTRFMILLGLIVFLVWALFQSWCNFVSKVFGVIFHYLLILTFDFVRYYIARLMNVLTHIRYFWSIVFIVVFVNRSIVTFERSEFSFILHIIPYQVVLILFIFPLNWNGFSIHLGCHTLPQLLNWCQIILRSIFRRNIYFRVETVWFYILNLR